VNQLSTASVVPQGSQGQGSERRYVQSIPLAYNRAGSGVYAVSTAEFEIWIPSTRLYVIATFGFLPDTQEDVAIPAGISITLDAWAKTDKNGYGGGRRIRGNSIIPGPFALPGQLPLSYEAITGVDQWRGRLTLPPVGTAIAVNGTFMLSASWEPAPGDNIGGVELRRIFDTCKVNPGANAGIIVTQTGLP